MSVTLERIEREIATDVLDRIGDAMLDVFILNPEITREQQAVIKPFVSAIIEHVREQYE